MEHCTPPQLISRGDFIHSSDKPLDPVRAPKRRHSSDHVRFQKKHDNNSLASQILIFQRGKCIFSRQKAAAWSSVTLSGWLMCYLGSRQKQGAWERPPPLYACLQVLKKTHRQKEKSKLAHADTVFWLSKEHLWYIVCITGMTQTCTSWRKILMFNSFTRN